MTESLFYRLSSPAMLRWIFGWLFVAAIGGGLAWMFLSDGIPVLWGPSASASQKQAGRKLFEHEWTPNDPLASGDGLGPVFNAKSCVACHFQGGVGGAGDQKHNAVHFEALPNLSQRPFISGVLHSNSVNPGDKESMKVLRDQFPIIEFPPPPPPPPGHCGYVEPKKPPFDPLRVESVQSPALFGIGWIDRIPSKAITVAANRRGVATAFNEIKGEFHGVPVGKVPYTADGRVGKFGWKGQFASVEEFVSSACANELGLGTPLTPQAKPVHKRGMPEQSPDLTKTQFRQLVAFVDTLPKPIEVSTEVSEQGKQVFHQIGCAACHQPDMGGVKGVYSDFLLYTLDDPTTPGGNYGPEPPASIQRPEHVPAAQEWKTPPLWGVADSAPYMHDGSATTLQAAILRHNADAKSVRKAFEKLGEADKTALIKFLESLKAPTEVVSTTMASLTR